MNEAKARTVAAIFGFVSIVGIAVVVRAVDTAPLWLNLTPLGVLGVMFWIVSRSERRAEDRMPESD